MRVSFDSSGFGLDYELKSAAHFYHKL